MKNRIIHTFLCTALLLPFICYSQEVKLPVHRIEEEEYEKQDDPYLPNAYNNEKLSPAYRYDSGSGTRSGNTEIFTRQVNVHTQSQLNFAGNVHFCPPYELYAQPA